MKKLFLYFTTKNVQLFIIPLLKITASIKHAVKCVCVCSFESDITSGCAQNVNNSVKAMQYPKHVVMK